MLGTLLSQGIPTQELLRRGDSHCEGYPNECLPGVFRIKQMTQEFFLSVFWELGIYLICLASPTLCYEVPQYYFVVFLVKVTCIFFFCKP